MHAIDVRALKLVNFYYSLASWGTTYMTFLLSVFAGAIGANLVSGMWNRYALSGIFNIAVGIIAGTAIWTLMLGGATLAPSLGSLLVILTIGGISGGVFSLALGSLQRVIDEY